MTNQPIKNPRVAGRKPKDPESLRTKAWMIRLSSSELEAFNRLGRKRIRELITEVDKTLMGASDEAKTSWNLSPRLH